MLADTGQLARSSPNGFIFPRTAQDHCLRGLAVRAQPSPVAALPGTPSMLTGLANTATPTRVGGWSLEQHAGRAVAG